MRLAVPQAVRCVKAIGEALDYAHRQGVIHRDIKPGNVLIDTDGRPHLMDFGLAKEFVEAHGGDGRRAVTTNTCAIIGTRGTIESHVFEKECAKRSGVPVPLIESACPLLVPLIEEGWHTTSAARMILRSYLRPLKLKKPTSLLLGCTHYPILAKEIRGMMGPRTTVIEPGPIVAASLASYLKRHPEITSKLSRGGTLECFTTDSTERIRSLASRFWGTGLSFEKVSLDSET